MAPLLDVRDLHTEFRTGAGTIRAVDGISYAVEPGETVAIVGESGSGKSVSALSILRLIPDPPGRITRGEVRFLGRDLMRLSEAEMREVRGGDIGMVFQEPMTSLNPVLTIGRQITETLEQHRRADRAAAHKRAVELLGLVGIADPVRRLKQYPHQLSGGMRQRVMIAIALACDPKLIIADEPTTALDVTIQAQILELMSGLTRRLGVALIIITHNLGVVARYAKRVNVMYAGRIVESGPAAAIYHEPRHPYTLALLRSVPRLDRPRDRLVAADLLVQLHGLGDLVADGEHRVQRRHRLLEDHRDLVAADPLELGLLELDEVAALEEDPRALRDPAGPVDQAHHRERRHRLAAARLADDRERAALVDLEVDPVDRPQEALPRVEARAQVLDGEQRRAHARLTLAETFGGAAGAGTSMWRSSCSSTIAGSRVCRASSSTRCSSTVSSKLRKRS